MPTESIKHLVFREEPAEIRRFPRYRSKYTEKVKEEVHREKECHRTFGLPKELLAPTPLKRGTRKVIRPDVEKWKPSLPKKMPVPRREDWVKFEHGERPNFPLRNAMNVVRSAPPQGPSRVFDSTSGRRVHNCNLRIPVFSLGEGFGKVPKYLEKAKKVAEENRRRREEQAKLRECEENTARGVNEVSTEDREELIRGLKGAWEELTRQYKLLPLVVDSTPMIKKKRNLEANLDRIEKNIDLLERNKHIFIKNNGKYKM